MAKPRIYHDGLNQVDNWIIYCRNNQLIYGFKITEKQAGEQKEQSDIGEMIDKTEDLRGNKTGNTFITTQINYDGKP